MPTARPYTAGDRARWDGFVDASKNATFLFHRDYMEYHADRFADRSLLVEDGSTLVALLPLATRDGATSSHGGLTYGGFLTDHRMTAAAMLETFACAGRALLEEGISSITYKPIPHIYHRLPAEEDLYALFRAGAALARRDVSATLRPGTPGPRTKGRKWSVSRARRAGLEVRQTEDLPAFMRIEAELLELRYGASPTHSLEEMSLLARRFPRNIRLFGAHQGAELLGGVLVYETATVAHAQYIASTERGKELGATDATLLHLIEEVYADKPWFDFGISTVEQGRVLNASLDGYKESWGARTTIYDWYQVDCGRMAELAP